MRPATLDEDGGVRNIFIGKDKLLYRAIKADKISSIIFYGPPGTGKTTLAKSCQYDQSKFCTDECNNIWEERYAGSGGRCERISWNVSEEDDLVYR